MKMFLILLGFISFNPSLLPYLNIFLILILILIYFIYSFVISLKIPPSLEVMSMEGRTQRHR